jgi:DNA replication protein DnaC
MLAEHTVTKLNAMRLDGMAEAYMSQRKNTDVLSLDFEERFGMLVESQWLYQENRALERRLKTAKLKINASIEDINWRKPRNLDREMINRLASSEWIRYSQNCIITGPTGVGKSFIACALGQKACRDGHKVLYLYAPKLFRELLSARATGMLDKLIRKLSRMDLLVIDDWGLESAKQIQYRDFLEVLDERYGNGAVVISSQYPLNDWHELIEDKTVADAILDRIAHNSYNIEMKGDSMRKLQSK